MIETTEILLENPGNDNARGEFAWAATMALNGMTLTGTSGYSYPNHMIEHSLSALYNVPHGAGLSVVMPAWMKWYSPKNPGQFERFANRIFGLSTPEEGIAALENWFNRIGTPTRLSQLGIGEKDLPAIVDNVLTNAQAFALPGSIPERSSPAFWKMLCDVMTGWGEQRLVQPRPQAEMV